MDLSRRQVLFASGAVVHSALITTAKARPLRLHAIASKIVSSVPNLGYAAAREANPKRLEVFKQGLAELGYVEGKNLTIEYREGVLVQTISR